MKRYIKSRDENSIGNFMEHTEDKREIPRDDGGCAERKSDFTPAHRSPRLTEVIGEAEIGAGGDIIQFPSFVFALFTNRQGIMIILRNHY